MSERLLVGTRKGLFILKRAGGRWTLAAPQFLGEPVSAVLHDPRDGALYAALNLGHFGSKLHRSKDGGASWQEVAVPAYPPQPESAKDDKTPWKLELLWTLEAAGSDQPGVLWAGTIPGGLFRSDDSGETWKLNEPLWTMPQRQEWFGGGYDHPGLHSVCIDPRDSRRVSIAVSTAGVWQTRDGGATWKLNAKGMRAEYMPPDQAMDELHQDVHRMVQCPSRPEVFWAQHHNGIFRSTDGCESWHEISTNAKPSAFGFAAAVHPKDPDTAWFVPAVKDQCRVPVDAKLVVSRTRDGGKTFEVLRKGLPQEHAYDLVYRHGLALDDTGARLAIGSTTGGLWISEDQGDSWSSVSTQLPPIAAVRFA